jgi:two-component system, OmpR family, response regulator CpxR
MKKPVLIVEDDDLIRDVLEGALREEGYTVYSASNGQVALELLVEIPRPVVILLDLMMPVMTGRELLTALRADDTLAAIPVTVISAARDLGDLQGVPILRKPVDFGALLRTIEELAVVPSEPGGRSADTEPASAPPALGRVSEPAPTPGADQAHEAELPLAAAAANEPTAQAPAEDTGPEGVKAT